MVRQIYSRLVSFKLISFYLDRTFNYIYIPEVCFFQELDRQDLS